MIDAVVEVVDYQIAIFVAREYVYSANYGQGYKIQAFRKYSAGFGHAEKIENFCQTQ